MAMVRTQSLHKLVTAASHALMRAWQDSEIWGLTNELPICVHVYHYGVAVGKVCNFVAPHARLEQLSHILVSVIIT